MQIKNRLTDKKINLVTKRKREGVGINKHVRLTNKNYYT